MKNIIENLAEINPAGESLVVASLPIAAICPNKMQPRSNFDDDAIRTLADSIARCGIIQPLTVRRLRASPDEFELIAGERRLRAAKLAGLDRVPCVITDADDSKSAEMAIVENLMREDLNIFEQAEAIKRLCDRFGLTQEEVASKLSLSQSAVANKLRLLRFPDDEREIILSSGLTERHARALLRLRVRSIRRRALEHIAASRMTVSASEAYIDKLCAVEQERTSGSAGLFLSPRTRFSDNVSRETSDQSATPRVNVSRETFTRDGAADAKVKAVGELFGGIEKAVNKAKRDKIDVKFEKFLENGNFCMKLTISGKE